MRKLYWLYSSIAFVMLASVDEPSCGGSGSTGDVAPTVNVTNNNCNINGGTGDCSNNTVNQGAGGVEEDLSNVPPIDFRSGTKAYPVKRVRSVSDGPSEDFAGGADGPARALTPAEYADQARAVVFDGTYEYLADRMPLAVAADILAGSESDDEIVVFGSDYTGTADDFVGTPAGFEATVLGSLTTQRNNTSVPWRQLVSLMRNNPSEQDRLWSDCTAVLIGPSTAITAAHCVWDKWGKQQWFAPYLWSMGVDGLDVRPYPYQPGQPYPSPVNGTPQNCYWVSFPSGYREVGTSYDVTTYRAADVWRWDFAVLEFNTDVCPLTPGYPVGWFGVARASSGRINEAVLYAAGYGDSVAPGNIRYAHGLGFSYAEVDAPFLLHRFPLKSGDSGGPLWIVEDSRRYVVGWHIVRPGSAIDGFGQIARRFDLEVRDYITRNSRRATFPGWR